MKTFIFRLQTKAWLCNVVFRVSLLFGNVIQFSLVVQIFVRVGWRNTTCPLFPLCDSFWLAWHLYSPRCIFYTEFSLALSPGALKLQEKFRMNSFGSRQVYHWLNALYARCAASLSVLVNNCQNMSIHAEFLFCQFFWF